MLAAVKTSEKQPPFTPLKIGHLQGGCLTGIVKKNTD